MLQFAKRIFSLFKDLSSNGLKIESVVKDKKSGLSYLELRIEGRSSSEISRDPLELIKESNALSNFSKNDFDKIIATLLDNQKKLIEDKYKPRYILLKHQYSDQLKEPLLVYKDLKINQIYIKPAREIYKDIRKINYFSSSDSVCIGHLVGSYEAESEQKNKIKNPVKHDISALTN